jgi:hypothetical protein
VGARRYSIAPKAVTAHVEYGGADVCAYNCWFGRFP